MMPIHKGVFGLAFGAALVGGAAQTKEQEPVVTLELVEIDEIIDYSCIGEQVHAVGTFRVEIRAITEASGALHVQTLLNLEDLVATGLTSGKIYRYKNRLKDVFFADPLTATAFYKVSLAAPQSGPKVVLGRRTHVPINANGVITKEIFRTAESCRP